MAKVDILKRTVSLLLGASLSIGVLTACTSETTTSVETESTAVQSESVPDTTASYVEDVTKEVAEGIEGLSLQVLYETTGTWEDAMGASGLGQGVTFEGNAKRAFIRIDGVSQAVYQNVLFDVSVQRNDGEAAYASITPLNIGGALPAFILSYADDTELTDYAVVITAENAFEDKTRTIEVPKMEKENVITSGMAFPGDMVKIGETVYYYGGPERTMYEIGEEGVPTGETGFSLKAGMSLVDASNITSGAEGTTAIFTQDNVKMVDAQTKEAPVWPIGEGYSIVAENIEGTTGTLTVNTTTLSAQNAYSTVTWSKASGTVESAVATDVSATEDGSGREVVEDDLLMNAVAYFLQVAFAYTGEKEPIYFMSSESYYTLQQ